MMGLAPKLGREAAHHAVKHASDAALANGGSLADALMREAEVSAHLDEAAIRRLTDPASYLGIGRRLHRSCPPIPRGDRLNAVAGLNLRSSGDAHIQVLWRPDRVEHHRPATWIDRNKKVLRARSNPGRVFAPPIVDQR